MKRRATHCRVAAPRAPHVRRSRGFTLIELMVAMLLGLIVIAGAASVFVASSATYKSNQGLSEVQTNARIAFELMSRDLRQAGLNGCNDNGRVADVLNGSPADGGTTWWADWNNAVHGYGPGSATSDPALTVGTAAGDQVAGTDSIQLLGAADSGLSIASDNSEGGTKASIKLNEKTSDLQDGDVVVICDPDHAAIVQISTTNSSTVTFTHNTGNTQSPGNCSKGLGYPTVCSTNGNTYTYGPNSLVAKLAATDWYIGVNPAGGKSLYRLALTTSGGNFVPQAQEMVRNVTDMQIKYHQSPNDTFVDAGSVSDWSKVDAVSVQLTLDSTNQRAGTDAKPIKRTFSSTTTLRNRVH